MRRLTEAHIRCLRLLSSMGGFGALTAHIAARAKTSGPPHTTWATNRMKTLAKHGLVRRHEDNNERWLITDAGRAALAAQPPRATDAPGTDDGRGR